MRETHITLPELALIAGTRAALGAGLGLLLGERLSGEQRKAIGWTLLMVGVATTIPLAIEVFGRRSPMERERGRRGHGHRRERIGATNPNGGI